MASQRKCWWSFWAVYTLENSIILEKFHFSFNSGKITIALHLLWYINKWTVVVCIWKFKKKFTKHEKWPKPISRAFLTTRSSCDIHTVCNSGKWHTNSSVVLHTGTEVWTQFHRCVVLTHRWQWSWLAQRERVTHKTSWILTSPCLREERSMCSSWPRLSHSVKCETSGCSTTTQEVTHHGTVRAENKLCSVTTDTLSTAKRLKN